MDEKDPRIARISLTAAVVAISLAASGCKREEPGANAPPRTPVAERAAGESGLVAADGGRATSRSVFTVDAADLPGPQSSPLRVVFGSRGAGVAWVVERADGTHVVVHNGKAGRAVTGVDQISLSPDGERIAYGAQVDGAWRMMVDGDAVVPSSAVDDAAFSPDSRHVAYFASAGETKRVVVDRVEGPERRGAVGVPVFNADSSLLAFVEVPGEGSPARVAVSDLSLARVSVKASGVKQLVANDARTAIAAVVEDGNRQRVVVFGFARQGAVTRGPPYDVISTPAFGPDGATVAYVAEKKGRRLLVLGGKEAPLPEGSVSGAPVIRPDGAGVGVMMASSEGQFLHEAFVAARTENAQRYEEAAELAYAADGRSKAFCARKGGSWFVVANGKVGPPFDRVVSPTFSPDGKLLVYRARKDGRRFVVISDADGRTIRQLPAYEQVFPVLFTADGKSITYGVKDGRQLAWKVEPL